MEREGRTARCGGRRRESLSVSRHGCALSSKRKKSSSRRAEAGAGLGEEEGRKPGGADGQSADEAAATGWRARCVRSATIDDRRRSCLTLCPYPASREGREKGGCEVRCGYERGGRTTTEGGKAKGIKAEGARGERDCVRLSDRRTSRGRTRRARCRPATGRGADEVSPPGRGTGPRSRPSGGRGRRGRSPRSRATTLSLRACEARASQRTEGRLEKARPLDDDERDDDAPVTLTKSRSFQRNRTQPLVRSSTHVRLFAPSSSSRLVKPLNGPSWTQLSASLERVTQNSPPDPVGDGEQKRPSRIGCRIEPEKKVVTSPTGGGEGPAPVEVDDEGKPAGGMAPCARMRPVSDLSSGSYVRTVTCACGEEEGDGVSSGSRARRGGERDRAHLDVPRFVLASSTALGRASLELGLPLALARDRPQEQLLADLAPAAAARARCRVDALRDTGAGARGGVEREGREVESGSGGRRSRGGGPGGGAGGLRRDRDVQRGRR